MHNSLMPNLMVEDVVKTARFYQEVLGFTFIIGIKNMEGGMSEDNFITELNDIEFLDWANVKLGGAESDDAEFMFQSRESMVDELPVFKDAKIGASQGLYMKTDDVDAQYNQLKDKVDVMQEPVTKFYGMREWVMKDINGYILCFGKGLDE